MSKGERDLSVREAVRKWADATGCTTAEAIEGARRFMAAMNEPTRSSAPVSAGEPKENA